MRITIGFLLALALITLAGCPQKQGSSAGKGQAKVPEIVRENTGLPMRLVLPEDAVTSQDLDLIPPILSAGMKMWSVPFSYSGGFDTLVESFDKQLKKQKFSRLSGPTHDANPGFNAEDNIKPLNASGARAWVSNDQRIVVFLSYMYKRADEKTNQPELNNYQMNVIRADDPQVVKEPNKVVPIP